MTNRTDYTDTIITDQISQADEVLLLAVALTDKKIPLTLENAQAKLAEVLATRPELWTLTADRLAELWPPTEQS